MAPLILPCKKLEKFNVVVQKHYDWCKKTNKLSSMKGLVLRRFFIFQYLGHFEFTRDALRENLQM